jgi:hypothetical protein
MRPAGGNASTLKRWAEIWEISTEHFDPLAALRANAGRPQRRPLSEILVDGSTYSRHSLKERLYEEGLKERRCEHCGQDERWRGRRMALILDHVNGIATDNRLENLQIVCPNCAATLDTHCGRNKNRKYADRECLGCGTVFHPYGQQQRYCSIRCSAEGHSGVPQVSRRRAERPPEPELRALVAAEGYSAVGRRFGVSDNAIRKWLRQYERERAREAGVAAHDDLPHAA